MMRADDAGRNDAALAFLFLRATLGINIMIHGLSRVVSGTGQFAATMAQQFQSTSLPHSLVVVFGLALPWIELFTGALVLAGLFTRIALSLGALVILALTFGTTLRQDWNTAGLQLIYAAVYALLLAFVRVDRYSLDNFLRRRR